MPSASYYHNYKIPQGTSSYAWIELRAKNRLGKYFLVDTGATISILPLALWMDVAEGEKTPMQPTTMKIRAGNDTNCDLRGKSHVAFYIDGKQYTQLFYICADATAAILGMDFQAKYDMYLRPARNQLFIEGNKQIPCFEAPSFKARSRVQLHDTYLLAPSEEVIVPGRVKGASERFNHKVCMLEETNAYSQRTGANVCKVTVIPQQGMVPVRILNTSDEPVRLWKGATVAMMETITQAENIEDDVRPEQAEVEPCTCTCTCINTGTECAQLAQRVCCHELSKKTSIQEQYEYVTNSLEDQEGETYKQFEDDPEIPGYLKELYTNSISKLTSPLQRSRLAKVLCDYADCFAKNADDVGRTNLVKHDIDTGDHRPVHQRCRRFCRSHIQVIRDHVAKLSANGTIRPSNSNWAANPVVVDKKSGEKRLCIDYRGLNAVTMNPDSYMLPRIDDTLDALSCSKFFCTLDLIQGYHQVELNEKDKHKTAFHAPYCNPSQWEYNYMPFGLIRAPRTFQRLMDRVIQGLEYTTALAYLDDVIVFGRSIDETIDRLIVVLERLRSANLKLKAKKCLLFQTEVKYLGHVISAEGVATDPDKIKAVVEWHPPRTVKQVRGFLGMVNYYNRFIKNLAELADPLHRITKKNAKFVWGKEQQQSFENLKAVLASSQVMAYPNEQDMYILDTDASDIAMGAVLSQMQMQETGRYQERPIAYASKKFNPREPNYCARRRELLAIVTMVKHFDVYLRGGSFMIRTDHASLRYIRTLQNLTPQMFRWIMTLEQYSYSVEIRKGVLHLNADAMSRGCHGNGCICAELLAFERRHNIQKSHYIAEDELGPVEVFECGNPMSKEVDSKCTPEVCMVHAFRLQPQWSAQELAQYQDADPDIRPVRIWFKENPNKKPEWEDISGYSAATKSYLADWDRFVLQDDVLYRRWESQDGLRKTNQVFVPMKLKWDICNLIHNTEAVTHLGRRKTLHAMQHFCVWYRMHMDVALWIRACVKCQSYKKLVPKPKAPMQIRLSGEQNERVAIDICGALTQTERHNQYVLVVTDHFSKFTEAYPIPDQTALTVAKTLVNNWFLKYGPPNELHSDQGTNFGSALMNEVYRVWRVYKTRTSPYHPQGDGQVERYNRVMAKNVAILVDEEPESWDQALGYVAYAYNATVHESTGFTPNLLWFGRELRSMIGELVPCVEDRNTETYAEYALRSKKFLELAYAAARETSKKSAERTKTYHDRNLREFVYEPGDKVWVEDHSPKARGTRKLVQQYDGPWYILDKLGDVNYRMSLGPGCPIRVLHHNRLRPYETLPGRDKREIPDWIMKTSFTLRLRAEIEGYRFVKRSMLPGRRPLRCCRKRARIIAAQKKTMITKAHKRCRPGKPRVFATIDPGGATAETQRTRAGREVRKPDRLTL